jgi:hypothetical protein
MRSFFHLTDNAQKLSRRYGSNSKLINIPEIAGVMRDDIVASCRYSQLKHKFIAYI